MKDRTRSYNAQCHVIITKGTVTQVSCLVSCWVKQISSIHKSVKSVNSHTSLVTNYRIPLNLFKQCSVRALRLEGMIPSKIQGPVQLTHRWYIQRNKTKANFYRLWRHYWKRHDSQHFGDRRPATGDRRPPALCKYDFFLDLRYILVRILSPYLGDFAKLAKSDY